jgi:16S rRNA (cytidine1402-2'-O)-methyltransferase
VGAQLKRDINIIEKIIFLIIVMISAGLYLVSTPIGNLDDITFRAIDILKNSNLILCENTLNSKKLLKKYNISTKLEKYTDHDFDKKKETILDLLKSGQALSLISDSGSPLISDPGSQLINYLTKHSIKIYPIPGASALIPAIQLSGFLNHKKYLFVGFLPKKIEQKIKLIENQLSNNLVIYSTKQQLEKDIEAIKQLSDQFRIVVLKEITKIYEERIEITSDNLDQIDFSSIKGELVMVVDAEPKNMSSTAINQKEILKLTEEVGIKKAYQELKSKYKLSRNEFYKLALNLKDE